ncbi:Seven in absentia protein family [Popillia japonica]|uniref:Seven in absentia protein family n=1 Tax=Popillia japonica TaxID=7064 RepID=A0AAW1JUC6_POPJA
MVINILETKDLLELSLLKCKVCRRRLQSPILQVSGFANACGTCNSDTNAERNVDLEALLQKLYLPCNYAERGCEFEGNFDDVCIHEKVCRFQKIKCPLASYEQCDGHLDNIVEHMESKHPDNVLTVIGSHVSVKNPNVENTGVFYLLVAENLRFILRAELNVKRGRILYAFYCLNYNVNIDHLKISILLKYENTNCNVENIHVIQLGKGEVPRMFHEKDVVKLKYGILENFGCRDNITIKIDTAKSVTPETITAKLNESAVTSFYKCTKCSVTSKHIHYCSKTNAIVCCENCFKGGYQSHCGCSTDSMATYKSSNYSYNQAAHITIHFVIKLDEIKANTTFLCTNIGCNQQINGSDYEIHTKSQCRFRKVSCSFSTSTSCNWVGNFTDFISHLTKDHTDRVNQNSCEIVNSSGTSQQLCFIKDNKTFLQTYQISNNQQLAVTTRVIDGKEIEDRYKWLIYFKNSVNGCETLITNVCTNDEEKTIIDVTGYLTEVPFTFKVLFKRIGINSK